MISQSFMIRDFWKKREFGEYINPTSFDDVTYLYVIIFRNMNSRTIDNNLRNIPQTSDIKNRSQSSDNKNIHFTETKNIQILQTDLCSRKHI